MEVRVQPVGGAAAAELESLGDWLRGEPELAGRVRAAMAEPRPGELGTLGEALLVAVGSGGAVSVLAASLKAWLAQPRRSAVAIRVEGDGRTVELSADRVTGEQVEALVRQALGGVAPGE